MATETKLVTTVVRVNGLNPKEFLRAGDRNRYVGRFIKIRNGRFKDMEWPNSGFGNRYRVSEEDGNAERRAKLYAYFVALAIRLQTESMLRNLFFQLQGKALGCWCVDWNNDTPGVPLCHAAWLARAVDLVNDCRGSANGVNILPDGTIAEVPIETITGGLLLSRNRHQLTVKVFEGAKIDGLDV